MIRCVRLLSAVAASVLWIAACAGAQARKPEQSGPVTILDSTSFWRMFHTLKPPVVDDDGRITPSLRNVVWLDEPTPPAPEGWERTEFDDSSWLRTTAPGGCQTPYLARQCVRGRFRVTDVGKVKGLALSLDYHGGAVVYLNGKELVRRNLPKGPIREETLAEGYPLDVYVTASGDLIAGEGTYIARGRRAGRPDEDSRKRMAARVRHVENFAIPPSALRPGINVLAIELVRAPYHKVLLETEEQARGKVRRNKFDWYTCELVAVQLTTSSADGLEPNAARPAGLQVWNSDPMAADGTLDWGDRCEPLRPIGLVGPRGAVLTGKVVVGSDKPIAGLAARPGELKGPGGAIPASAVRIRYGILWGVEDGFCRGDGTIRSPYPRWPGFFGAAVDTAPEEVAVAKVDAPLVGGAVVPVWVTVRVPADVQPGVYTGTVTIAAKGEKPVAAPVRLEVVDWTLPDSQDFRTWVDLIQVPDTTALEYDVPLWSDRHFEMIAGSFRLLRDTGCRIVYISTIAHTNLGNAESMVRWIPKGDNRYEWDFSVMDRYLDLAQKNMGTPKIVVLQVWEIYMSSKRSIGKRFSPELDKRQEASGGAPLVTLLDRETGRTELGVAPALSDPASKAIWQRLLAEVRRRLRERGIEGALMLGMFTDAIPPKEDFEFFHEIAPDLCWVHQGHGRWENEVYGIAEVGYQDSVWGGYRFADGLKQTNQRDAPTVQSLYGWKLPRLDAVFERNLGLDTYPSTRWRFFPETAVTGELRGIGRIGADYWRVLKNRRGGRSGRPHDRFADGAWGGSWINLNLCNSVLAPGPAGPAATNRLVALVEGVQECEARIAIERALVDDQLKARLGSELAHQCQSVLDERLHTMWRTLSNYQLGGPYFFGATAWRWAPGIPGHRLYLGSDWQAKSRTLYELAGKVEAKVGHLPQLPLRPEASP